MQMIRCMICGTMRPVSAPCPTCKQLSMDRERNRLMEEQNKQLKRQQAQNMIEQNKQLRISQEQTRLMQEHNRLLQNQQPSSYSEPIYTDSEPIYTEDKLQQLRENSKRKDKLRILSDAIIIILGVISAILGFFISNHFGISLMFSIIIGVVSFVLGGFIIGYNIATALEKKLT